MPAIITSKFRFHNAEQFKESFSEAAATNYYLFIGRPGAFASGTTGGTDASPPTPPDNRRAEARYWDDMLAAKKIVSTGVTHAIPRRDLDTSGATKYDMYRPDYSASKTATSGATSLLDSTFYFVTSAYRVYKVLDNNGGANMGGGSAFTAPTSDDRDPFTVGGYLVKYMYTLSTTDVQNFLTPDFMPAPTVGETNKSIADGKLSNVLITTAGLATHGGAAWNPTSDRVITNVPIRGDGTGATASVTIGKDNGGNDGQVIAVTITSTSDSGYTHAHLHKDDILEQHNLQNASALAWTTDPVFEVIIPPDGGHGSNPAKELGGHFVLMDTKLEQTEGYDFSVVNDFRQVGVVRNPTSYGTASAYSGATARQTYAVKLSSNSGTFKVDEKIYQTITPVSVGTISLSGNTITVNTSAAHNLTTGQMVDITGGSWTGTGITNANGHQGTHHITVADADTFTFTLATSRTPAVTSGNLTPPGSGVSYTTFSPQGTVVEYDSGNNVLFYVQTMFDNQGTDAAWKQNIPFGGGGTITGVATGGGSATGVPNTSYSSALNNTSFTAGYANPEMEPDSGDVIYIENRKPISRASDQTEDIKLIVEF